MRKLGLALALASALAMSTFTAQPARADGGAVIAAVIITAVVVKLLVKGHVWAPAPVVVAPRKVKRRKK